MLVGVLSGGLETETKLPTKTCMDQPGGSTAEHLRLGSDRRAWMQWGPYVAERAWGTVRED